LSADSADRAPKGASSPGRWLPAASWVLILVALADWLALRRGWLGHPPALLAAIVAAALVGLLVRVVVLAGWLRQGPRRAATAAEMVLSLGVIVALSGGILNWLLALQGFVVLSEGESVRLHGGGQLQAFDAGPLARLEEMGLTLALDELELVPVGDGGFYPRSRLRVRTEAGQPSALEIAPGRHASAGPLRFYQGAFGFAPRVVVARGERTLFDRVVPFTTERHGPTGISFSGTISLAAEQLEIDGAVELASLDAGLRGHATLRLAVARDGVALGQGGLLPGHFAELADGYRVGFTGLERWSEIDIARRNYRLVVLAGALLAALGAILWLLVRGRAA